MERAYTGDYRLIWAKEAVKGRRYFCPICNGELHFYPGTKNTPHFRHGKSVPKEVKDTCELYSRNLDENTIYNQEFAARQCVRLILEKEKEEIQFKLKFPLIKQSIVSIQENDLYFTYCCEELPDFQLNTVHLLPSRQACEIKIPLINKYTIYCTNQQYEKKLGLRISGIYEPFTDGAIIFKEIQGQFISIHYRRIILSGRFFIVSPDPLLSIHSDIELINKFRYEKYYIFELIMPFTISDDLENWFNRIVGYTLLTSTCHLDIIKPLSFRKIGTTFEIASYKSSWLVTSIGVRHIEQRVILIRPNNHRQVFKIPLNRIVELNLSEPGDYFLIVDQEVTEMLTIRYSPKLDHHSSFRGQVSINNKNVLFKIREMRTEKVKFETDLRFFVHTENEINYEIKHGGKYFFNTPVRVDIPTLWSIKVQNTSQLSNEISFDNIFSYYEKYHLYPKMICTLKDLQMLQSTVLRSNFIHKDKVLYFIRRFGIRVPKPINEIIKEMKQ